MEVTDNDAYRREHMLIFGHYPVADLSRGRKCGHPMHDYLTQLMDMPGVGVEVPFDPHEIVTEDDPEVTELEELYAKETQKWRDVIQDVEEREEYDKKKKTGE